MCSGVAEAGESIRTIPLAETESHGAGASFDRLRMRSLWEEKKPLLCLCASVVNLLPSAESHRRPEP
jgi:hypothetical protein